MSHIETQAVKIPIAPICSERKRRTETQIFAPLSTALRARIALETRLVICC